MIGVISAFRVVGRMLPTLSLVAILGLALVGVRTVMGVEDRMEAALDEVAERDRQIAGLRLQIEEAEAARVRDLAAIEAEIARAAEQRLTFGAARASLVGLEDGEVAPVLDEALELFR